MAYVALHSGFNHLSQSPKASALAMLVVLPPLLWAVFQRSEAAVGDWLGKGFDADTEMLELINSGRLAESPVGQYLHTLKRRFKGPVVADLLCYLRLGTELALRAKGILMDQQGLSEAEAFRKIQKMSMNICLTPWADRFLKFL